jgi:hypothetical protein
MKIPTERRRMDIPTIIKVGRRSLSIGIF